MTPYLWYDNEEKIIENLKHVKVAFFGQLGYKYSLLNNKLFAGIAFTPLFRDAGVNYFIPMGALRFGYKF
jgi:hypothetical protein